MTILLWCGFGVIERESTTHMYGVVLPYEDGPLEPLQIQLSRVRIVDHTIACASDDLYRPWAQQQRVLGARFTLGEANRHSIDGAELCVDRDRTRCHVFAPRDAVSVRSELVCSRALKMTSATTWVCETIMTCEPSTSVIVAPARSAIERTTSVPAALSPVATTAQLGRVFHAGRPFGSENASSATGRCVAPTIAANSTGRSAAKASWIFPGSIANSTAVSVPFPVG